MRTTEEILRSLVADIEAMACTMPDELGDIPDADRDAFFGVFSVFHVPETGSGADPGAAIEWPNLRALVNEAKGALYFESKAPAPEIAPPPVEPAITLHSSHGDFYFDAAGALIRADVQSDEWVDGHTPVQLDLDEWRRAYPGENPAGEWDILDWAFTARTGEYVPAASDYRSGINRPGASK